MSITEPLSYDDMHNKLQIYEEWDNVKFLPYENIESITNIDKLLPKTIILYQNPSSNIGHWCCIFENGEGVNFFDPYGEFIDNMCKYSDTTPYLCKLLLKYPSHIEYNQYKLQGANSSTCGKWCAIRLLYNNLGVDEFYKCFKRYKNKDIKIANVYENL